MFWLISTNTFPPGEWSYVQSEGIQKQFGPSSELGGLVGEVLAFRRGNKLSRASYPEVWEDVIRGTCARLKNSPQWCYDTDQPASSLIPPVGVGCSGCGAILKT